MHKLIEDYINNHQYDLSNYNPSNDKLAIIIETRPTPYLEWVISNIKYHTNFPIKHISEGVNSFEDYNKLLTSFDFWKDLPENVLIFQSDSFMLKDWNPKFERYDFIGAPWKWAYEYKNCHPYQLGANGGFSFRKTTAMKRIILKYPPEEFRVKKINPRGNEDMYFTLHLNRLRNTLPNLNIQKQFGCESIYYNDPMSVHAIDKWLSDEEIKTILN